MLETAQRIEEEHRVERELKLEKDRQEQQRRRRDSLEIRLGELEDILRGDCVYLRLQADNRSNTAFKIEVSDTEEFSPASLLVDSRDFSAQVNETGMRELMETFARSYTFQGYDVYMDGEPYKPYSL